MVYIQREEPGAESFCVESSVYPSIVICRLYLSQTIRNLLILGIAQIKLLIYLVMPKQRTARRPKRRFSDNQFTKSSTKTAESMVSEQPCASTHATGIPEDTDDVASLSS